MGDETTGGVVVPAVKVAFDPQDLVAAGKCSRETKSQHGAFGPRVGQSYALGTGHHVLNQFAPVQFQFVIGAVVCAFDQLLLYGFRNGPMIVPQQQSAVTAGVVDVLVAVDVPLSCSPGMGDVDAVWLDIARIVGDTAREDPTAALGQSSRASRLLAIGGHQWGIEVQR